MTERNAKTAGQLTVDAANAGRGPLLALGFGGLILVVALRVFGATSVLPMLSALLVAAGFSIAAIAWISGAPRRDVEVTAWDLAGALALIGFAAAMLSL